MNLEKRQRQEEELRAKEEKSKEQDSKIEELEEKLKQLNNQREQYQQLKSDPNFNNILADIYANDSDLQEIFDLFTDN